MTVARLVYVSAIPRESHLEEGDLTWIDGDPHVHFLADGTFVLDNDLWLAEEGVRTFPEDVLDHVRRNPRRPVGTAALTEPQTRAAWKTTPTTVLFGRSDELSAPDLTRASQTFDDSDPRNRSFRDIPRARTSEPSCHRRARPGSLGAVGIELGNTPDEAPNVASVTQSVMSILLARAPANVLGSLDHSLAVLLPDPAAKMRPEVRRDDPPATADHDRRAARHVLTRVA